MCGIAGCIDKHNNIDKDRFGKMVDIISHRGPDDRGVFFDDKIALGHRRLSIIDVSMDGHQPFMYRDLVVVFNGEIYNYIELREELEKKGYTFRTKTDTEVLAASYMEWSDECVQHFNGMWAFAVYDKAKKTLFCSRDRFGVKPFYYTCIEDRFLFASEIKQFFEMADTSRQVNRDVLLQYIVRGDQNDFFPDTFFKGIYKLQPGHNLTYSIEKDNYSISKYFDIKDIGVKKIDYDEACSSFKDTFFDSVRLRLRADVPLGYLLSGGLDSSSIVSVADKIVQQDDISMEQHTLSSCFEDERYDEREYIEAVTEQAKVTPHYIFPQESDLFDDMDKVLWHMDEPFGSTSVYAQWNVFKGAKECGLKVMLDGQGADETLAGYTPFYTVMFADYLRKGQFAKFIKEIKRYKNLRAVTEQHISSREIIISSLVAAIFKGRFRRFVKGVYFSLPGKSGPFDKKTATDCAARGEYYPFYDSKEYIEAMIRYNLTALLHYEDRNSMAHSIESRVPFLDINLVENIVSMPIYHKLKEARTKSVLRDALSGILPDKVRDRYSKLGFVTPEDQWINNNKDKYRRELESAVDILNPLLDKKRVLNWFDSVGISRGDFTVWRIICAAHWVKLFNVEV